MTKQTNKNNKKKNAQGVVTGYKVVKNTSGKETLNLQIDADKLRKIQDKQEKARRKQSRKRAVKQFGSNIQGNIRNRVKDEVPKSSDADLDIKASALSMHFINVIAMILAFAVIAIILVVAKRESGRSEHDNRELAKFPALSVSSWFDGSFTSGVTDFYTDTIPYREDMLTFSSSFSKLFGLPKSSSGSSSIIGNKGEVETQTLTGEIVTQDIVIHTGPAVTTTTTADNNDNPDVTTTPSGTTTTAATLPVENDDGKLENGIMIVGSGSTVRALECYGGSFPNGKKYAEFVNKYKQDLGEYVNVYSMCIPTAFAFYCPEKYKDEYGSTIDNINNIRSYLNGVIDIDAYGALEGHVGEYIYSRTDHHWQPIGAYYAAQAFAKTAQVSFADISTYEKVVEEDFVGTLYAYSGNDVELLNNPDTFIYYKPANNSSLKVRYYDANYQNGQNSQLFFKAYNKANLYSSFLGTDKQVAEIKTNCDNGRTLVIFKDSFGNALVPFLTSSFSNIYVIDIRYFTPNAIEFCQNVGATDVLFATCMFTCTSNAKINYIENLRIQNKTR